MPTPAGTALIYIPVGVAPCAVFAGHTLVERARALAEAAALRPVVVGMPAGGAGNVAVVPAGAPLPPGSGPIVLLRCDVACVASVVRDLAAAPGPLAVPDDAGRLALVRCTAADLAGNVPASLEEAAAGIHSLPRAGLLGTRSVQALAYARSEQPAADMGPARRAAERRFLRSLDNPRDGYFDGVLNRRLSRPLSRFLLPSAITPNQVTIAALLLSLVGAACIALPGLAGPVLGALLLQLTAVLDCVDGEIARAKVLETEWGEWLDITSDTLIHVATFLGIAVHAWPELGRTTAWTLGGLFTVGGLASFVVVTRAEKTEDTWKRSDDWRARLLALLLATLTTRDLSVLVLVAAAADLLTPLLVGAALGAQVFWCGTLALHESLMRRVA